MSIGFDEVQEAAIEAPFDGPLLIIRGRPGTGKSTTLARRVVRAAQLHPQELTVVSATSPSSLQSLQHMLPTSEALRICSIEQLAFEVLKRHSKHTGLTRDIERIDEVDAANLFERASASLLSMEWAEFIDATLDPEVPGLRAPQRFCLAAFHLIRKLRDADIGASEFLKSALHGAARFYAKPPNFAHPDLLYYTKDSYRDSLRVSATELERQYRREVDLTKILEHLYRSYLDLLAERGCLTAGDAVAQGLRLLRENQDIARLERKTFNRLFIDDVQELTVAQLAFLQGLFGETLSGVTFAGDATSAMGTFKGARPDRVFSLPAISFEFETQFRCTPVVETAAQHLLGEQSIASCLQEETRQLTLFRAATRHAEAKFIAEHVAGLLQSGVSPDDIAILFRSVLYVETYESALLDRNIEIQTAGDVNLFKVPDVRDALAVLWSLANPFRHDQLLRVLSGGALRLCDATLQLLCSDPPSEQRPLFLDNPQARGPVLTRWDRNRDIRLGWNVTRGDQDASISTEARKRLQEFRSMRCHWIELSKELSVPHLVRCVLADGLTRSGAAGSARAAHQQRNLSRFLYRVDLYAQSHPNANLSAFLAYAESRAASESETCESENVPKAVRLLSVEATVGKSFEHVIVANVRAGSFPRYYAPEAFLFSPSLGMIAKENVGDARASRTAKFTYYMYRTKAREAYNREERRTFVYALRRAKTCVTVTASERSTRGINTPEFLSELQAARLPNAIDLSGPSKPSPALRTG